MISIRRLLEQRTETPPEDRELLEATLQLRRLLQDVIAIRSQLGHEAGMLDFELKSRELLHRLDDATSAVELILVANEALEAIEEFRRRSTEYFLEQGSHLQSMLSMMAATVAEISGQSDNSVARLLSIERRIEQASGLEDMRALKNNLAQCLTEVREAVVQQKSATSGTVGRLREQMQSAPGGSAAATPDGAPVEPGVAEFVAVVRLQRAENVGGRFGERVRDQMLSVMGENLKAACGAEDRLMRWKGASFVMFVKSADGLLAVRRKMASIASKIGQRYVEVGNNSALLAISVDWMVYPQSRYPTLEAVFAEVDTFLAKEAGRISV